MHIKADNTFLPIPRTDSSNHIFTPERTRTKIAKLLIILLMFLCTFACAYTGNIRKMDNTSTSGGKARYNLKSAVVVTNQQKNETVSMQVDIASVSMKPYPVLYEIIQEKMKQVFSKVDLVDESALIKDNYDVLINTSTKIGTNRNVFELNFSATGLETKAQDELFRASNNQKEQYIIPPAAAAYAFLTGFTLFVASPITIPLSVSSIGDYSDETVSKMLSKALDESVSSMLANPILKMYAEGYRYDEIVQALSAPVRPIRNNKKYQEEPASSVVKSDIDELPSLKSKPNKDAYAIVIGIEQYRQKIPKADYAVADAKIVAEYLTKVMGFPEENIVTLTNDHATKSDFEKYFEKWLSNNAEKNSTVFIYYSGHGAPNSKTGDAYLVPYDGDPTFIEQTGYPLKKLYHSLNQLQAKEVIVALDSCFSGAGGRSVLAKGARPLVMNLQNNMDLSRNITVLAASSGDQTSSTYDEKGHGLFTYFMLKGIKNEDVVKQDGSIAISDLFSYMKPQVERIARKQYNNEQTPQLIGAKKN
jgi:hypothetical protein